MRVRVKLYASLRRYLPPHSAGGVTDVEVAAEVTPAAVLAELGIPAEHAGMLIVGGEQVEPNTPLREGEVLEIFQPLAGGV